jgi:hypothetical protein
MRSRIRHSSCLAAFVALAVLAPGAALADVAAASLQSAPTPALRYIGGINVPQEGSAAPAPEALLGVDPVYGLVSSPNVQQLDLVNPATLEFTRGIPTHVSNFNQASWALDISSHQVYLGRSCFDCASGQAAGPLYGSEPSGSIEPLAPFPAIQVVGLAPASTPHLFSFTAADGAEAGQAVAGLRTYDLHGRHYLFAMLYHATGEGSGPNATLHKTTVVALDADKMVTDPSHAALWNFDVPNCVRPPVNGQAGAYLGIASTGDYLYFICQALGTATLVPTTISGPSAVLRVNLDSSDPAQQRPANFSVESFPFAADLTQGSASGDPAHNLLYVLAPGSDAHFYVFDVAHRSYTGSVPLFFFGTNVPGVASDPATGRAYLVVQDFKIFVTDATSLPVQVGTDPETAEKPPLNGAPVFDPTTRRLFVAGGTFCKRDGSCHDSSMHVFADSMPPAPVATPDDPDAQTHQVDEAPGTPVSYRGFATAYGARLSAVGGAHGTQVGGLYDDAGKAAQLADPGFPNTPDADRTLYLGRVSGNELSDSAATGDAAPMTVDKESTSAAGGLQSFVTSQLPTPFQDGLASVQQALNQVSAQTAPASCSDLGDAPQTQVNPSATAGAYCDHKGLQSGAQSQTVPAAPLALPGDASIGLAAAASWTSLKRDPKTGTVANATAIARGLQIQVPGAGSVEIGEVKTVASSAAHGRTGTATSDFTRSVSEVVVSDAQGQAKFACGFTDPGSLAVLGGGNPCDARQLTAQLDAQFPGRVRFVIPTPDADPAIAHSAGGAQAEVIKTAYDYWNGFNTSHDTSYEVPGLQVFFLNDSEQPSRLVLSLAGLHVQSHYTIGQTPPPPAELPDPSLDLSLVDGNVPPAPLSGATFTLNGPEGTKPVTCLTAADGIGTCKFTKLTPGEYTISETTPPPGFAPVEDYELTLDAGKDYKTTFVNLAAIGSVELTLLAPDDDATPIPGGVFALHKGKALLDTALATCTTGDDGTCDFDKVPLGDYTMEQVTAPDTFIVSDPVEFSLTKPAQVARLRFVDGVPGKEAVPPVVIPGTPPIPPKVIPGKPAVPPKVIPGKPAVPPRTMVLPAVDGGTGDAALEPAAYDTASGPQPVVASQPSATGPLDLGTGGLAAVSARLARLVIHSPQQAVLLLFVWLVLGMPVYLWVRRRQFITATEGF